MHLIDTRIHGETFHSKIFYMITVQDARRINAIGRSLW